MKRILTLFPLVIAICVPSAFAIVDTNTNGMSDLWEQLFNGGQLFEDSFNGEQDDDNDGWKNVQEAAAGTDPRNANSPDGFLRPELTILHDVYLDLDHDGNDEFYTDIAKICWPVIAGKQYTLLLSSNLAEGIWVSVESARSELNGTRTCYFPLALDEMLFWKVMVEDVDTDVDSFNDYEEYLKGTDIWIADRDDDGLSDDWEFFHGLDATDDGTIDPDNGPFGDPDDDGLYNLYEYISGADPRNSDSDADGLTDYEEVEITFTDPTYQDSNSNGVPDAQEDPDRDGLNNFVELRTHHTDPQMEDTDHDTLRDGWEVASGLNPLIYDSTTDPDGDGLTNFQEQRLALRPLDDDSDDDGTQDGAEDPDGDGLLNLVELSTHHTDPLKADTDSDGLSDYTEIHMFLTNPSRHDTDSDGMPDGWEIQHELDPLNGEGIYGAAGDFDNDGLGNFQEWLNCSDPLDADSDNDGANDLAEVDQSSDPNDPADGGSPPVDGIQQINFTAYGDYASWRMEICGEGPRDHRTMFVVTSAVGVPETGVIKLHQNNKYKVTLHHTGSKEGDDQLWYCWEARVDDKPSQQTFPNYETERIPGAAMFFTIGDGHWLVDNRDGLLTAHNHRTETDGGNLSSELEATLLPIETVVGDAEDIEDSPEGFVAAEAAPTPSVVMTVASSTLQGGDLHIRLEGTVKDLVSRFAQSSAERPQTLKFFHQDELLHSIPLDETVGLGFVFDETVVITNAKPESYVIRAETTENIAGKKGYDESSVSLTEEEDASAFPVLSAPLSIAFAAAPGSGTVDQATVFIGNSMPQAGDTALTETVADSVVFTGNLRIPAQPADITAPCQLKFQYPPAFSTTEADSVVVHVEYTAPGYSKNHFYGRWIETGANTLIFRPGSWVFGNQVLRTAQTANRELRGTLHSGIEACTIRFPELPASLVGNGLQVVSGGIAYDLIQVGDAWYPEDPDQPGEIRRFMPSAHPVPARLFAQGYDPQQGSLTFTLRYPETLDMAVPDILILPSEESVEPPIAAAPNPPAAARIYSLETASEEAPPAWQPGNPVVPEHVIWAYRFLNANDTFAIELLDGYLRGGHQIETKGFWFGVELDLDVALNDLLTDEDNIWTIQIAEDVNPIYAARLLFEGLKQSTPYKEVFDHFAFEDPMDEIQEFKAAMATAVQKTQETAIAATEMYLSGLGIINEGLDWIIVVNDVSEGHWESLAAALPFVPAGLVKTGGNLIIKKGAGEVLDTLDGAGVDALKQLYRENDLRVMGVTMEEFHFSESLRKSLSTSSGPVTAPTAGMRDYLRKAMEALGPKPKGRYTAHHDLIWAERAWFARHGIDVNNPAFGRWASKFDHQTWHSGIGMESGGRFNYEWRRFIAAEKAEDPARVYTYSEIIDKLADIRAQFPVAGGHN